MQQVSKVFNKWCDRIKEVMKNKEKLKGLLLEMMIAFLFCFASFMFLQKSPQHIFKGREPVIDSAVFETVALMMKNGKMPYLDTFDHKGPLIYIINYIGLSISYNHGVWLLEVINLTITLYFLYKIARLKCDKFFSVITAFIALAPLFSYFDGGNYTEEFALPFLTISLFIFLDYLLNDKINKFRLIVCGMSLSCVLLLRPNMISVWIIFCIYIFIKSIIEKKFKELNNFIAYFLIGMVIVMLPIMLWLGIRGALADFWNDYIVFNLQYSSDDSDLATTENKWVSFIFFFKNTVMILSFIIVAYTYKQKKSTIDIVYIGYITLTLLLICVSGRHYGHYGIITIPIFAYPMSLLFEACQDSKIGKETSHVISMVLLMYLLGTIVLPGWIKIFEDFPGIYKGRNNNNVTPMIQNICDIIIDNTDEGDKISVYGNRNLFYVLTQKESASKYSYQFPIGKIREEILDEYFEDISKELPKVIIIPKYRFEDTRIFEFLDKNNYSFEYEEIEDKENEDEAEGYKVYILKNSD